jgi:hypothetical protein
MIIVRKARIVAHDDGRREKIRRAARSRPP